MFKHVSLHEKQCFLKNYAYLASYDDGVVLTSSVSKFRAGLHRFHRKRSKLSRVLFVTSDHPWVGRGWVAGGPWVGHKAGRVIGHPPREERKKNIKKERKKETTPGNRPQSTSRPGISYSVRGPPLSDIYVSNIPPIYL